ncbi:hypothetical protein DSCA_53480 [Desulfosarcina alkanivorans]|uniref:Uncharacterized protein n=1 Tax=Desulfosarcina alkanivorans TaxID=571177 RepID=A0A5K7YRU8_9BACT|nr:hypothetical protein [Desulfosarcina alkanivorans]BBO71418.1 hypothetical protein DSCA_53480 [Desulfosarcina alkanivorans]
MHLYQQIGLLKLRKLPFWFKEGFITFVSDGGGAGTVSELEATELIKNGNYFVPNLEDGLFSQKSASHWGLNHHMMYRQNMMFISFLRTEDEKGFRRFLLMIQDGDDFQNAFITSFDKSLDDLWQKFLLNYKG